MDANTLVFSFIGMDSQEISIGTSTQINITMAESVTGLNEVVVVGYGEQKKRNVTGAISSVKGSDLNKSTITNFTQDLAGKVPGLTALQSSGQPGAGVDVQIRSNPSFASSGVLYILDGVPVNDNAGEPGTARYDQMGGSQGVDRSSLNFINPNDIESIEVLKDAAAASIYGARAGAGVILITTKHGKSGKPKIEYSGSYALQEPAKFIDVLGTKDFMTERNHTLKDMWMRDNNISPYGNADPSMAPPFVPKYTDAQISNTPQQESAMKAITRNGFINQHNLSLSGGNSDTRYFVSGNYFTQQGIILGADYTRYNGRFNLDQVVTKHIKMGIQLSTSNSNTNNASLGLTPDNHQASIISSASIWSPIVPLINSDGTYTLNPEFPIAPNPLSFREIADKTASARLLTNGYVEWTIIPDLKAKASFSYDQSSSKRSAYYPKSYLYGTQYNGLASIEQRSNTSNLLEYTLNYVHKFGENQSVNFLGGYSYQLSNWEGLSAGNYNFITDNFLYNNLGSGSAPSPNVGSNKSNQIWASYFARAIYELKNKYLFNATIRRDGSSVFAENKKYGIFPSVSAGWIVSEEPFLKGNIPSINFLKLRASYGTTGNSNIGNNAFAYYSTGWNYAFNNQNNTGVYLSQLNNDNLTWETAREVNIGIDYQILENRITGSFDYFDKTISNLLTYRPLPTSFPVSSIADNIGKTRSRGWELGIQTKNVVSANDGGFEWNTEFTLSHHKNSWIERSPEELKILAKYIDPKGLFNGIYGYQSDGMYTGKTTAPAWMPGILPGTVIIKDLNGYDANGNLTGKPDGQISSADMVLLANGDPKLSFGFKNTFRYKNFDLSIYMYGITGIKYNTYYQTAFIVEGYTGVGLNLPSIIKDRWSYDNQNSKFPSGLNNAYTDYASNSDYWLEKSSFLRCRDITLGYTIPSNIIKKQNAISGLRVNLSVQNAFIITNYRGLDPELSGYYSYPDPRSVVFGLNASF